MANDGMMLVTNYFVANLNHHDVIYSVKDMVTKIKYNFKNFTCSYRLNKDEKSNGIDY